MFNGTRLEPTMMSLELQVQLAAQITLAMILSGVIGINRERSNKSAGLRTHMLTGTGACIFTILSLYAFPNSDTSRVASNIVTGIGFLGGGIIIQRKNEAYDLTTAAGVWATAAIGMAMGVGAWFLAVYSTLVFWFILAMVKRVKILVSSPTPAEVASKAVATATAKKSKPKEDQDVLNPIPLGHLITE